jgi:hypothetical protein
LRAGVEAGRIDNDASTLRLDAHQRSLPRSTTVTWFNCCVEVTDQVTNEPSHQVTESLTSPSIGSIRPCITPEGRITRFGLNLLFPVPIL